MMVENSYSIQEFGQLINQHGYSFDLNKNPQDSGLIDEISYSSRTEIFIGASQKNGIKIIFKYDGIGTVTLFDPNETDIRKNTVTLNIPINGYFFDPDEDVFYHKNCHLKSYEPYEELRLGFFEYINLFIGDRGEQNFDWLKGRDEGALKCIYCIDLNTVNNLLDNVKIVINSDSKLIKNIKSTQDSISYGQPSIQQTEPNIESLNAEISRLRKLVAEKDAEIEQLKAKQSIEQLGNHLPDELTGLPRRNQLAQDRQGMARIIALNLWKSDETILIGDMANKVSL
ncbi:hypothetical protein ACG94O_15730 [Acinetobacter ursingii]|uniref:hypothetical protein n=1 Tax=Acinetobacter ursingii TaxID=108980 RepID=UPI003AF952B7